MMTHVDVMNDLVLMGLARDQAHAEVERLRAALAAIANWSEGPSGSTTAERSMRRIAQQALAEEPGS